MNLGVGKVQKIEILLCLSVLLIQQVQLDAQSLRRPILSVFHHLSLANAPNTKPNRPPRTTALTMALFLRWLIGDLIFLTSL